MRDLTFYSSWLRVCAKCGHGLWWRTKPIDLYCEPCWLKLDGLRNRSYSLLQESTQGPLEKIWIYGLFTWTVTSEPWVKPLMYQLKRGGLPGAYARLAELFAFEMGFAQDLAPWRGKLVFVVPPSRGPQEQNHAWLWASEFARLWGGEVWSGLRVAETPAERMDPRLKRTQKSKTRSQRRERRYELTELLPQGKFFIFVDDVLTTGATAEAAWRALKEPHCFQVWVIAYRPKLAGFSSIC